MKVVVDTDIVFSSIFNSSGLICELPFNTGQQFVFYTPEFMVYELSKYKLKLQKFTDMTLENVDIPLIKFYKKSS